MKIMYCSSRPRSAHKRVNSFASGFRYGRRRFLEKKNWINNNPYPFLWVCSLFPNAWKLPPLPSPSKDMKIYFYVFAPSYKLTLAFIICVDKIVEMDISKQTGDQITREKNAQLTSDTWHLDRPWLSADHWPRIVQPRRIGARGGRGVSAHH